MTQGHSGTCIDDGLLGPRSDPETDSHSQDTPCCIHAHAGGTGVRFMVMVASGSGFVGSAGCEHWSHVRHMHTPPYRSRSAAQHVRGAQPWQAPCVTHYRTPAGSAIAGGESCTL
jgi:hypothetical protein